MIVAYQRATKYTGKSDVPNTIKLALKTGLILKNHTLINIAHTFFHNL